MPSIRILFWVVIANYLAQIPYYLINYYFPSHLLPSPTAIILLGLTLVWFLAGFFAVRRRRAWGYWVLLSYLIVVVLFYLNSLIFGAAQAQILNPNPILKVVFIVGYVAGAVSAVSAVFLLRNRHRLVGAARPDS
jgi:hypothetical protein